MRILKKIGSWAGVGLIIFGLAAAASADRGLFSEMSFDMRLSKASFEDPHTLAKLMTTYTDVDISTSGEVIFLAAVLQNGEVLYAATSRPVGAESLESGRIRSVWGAFEDPVFGFEDPTFGRNGGLQGVWGTDGASFRPLVPETDFVWGTDGTFFNPRRGVDAVWGSDGASFHPKDVFDAVWGSDGASFSPDEKVLMVLAIPAEASDEAVRVDVGFLAYTSTR